jgi:hypothetical protein
VDAWRHWLAHAGERTRCPYHGVVDERNVRLETALRMLTKARLLSMQVPNYALGRWCDAWEAEAARRGLEPSADSWEDGIRWIVAKVAAGEQPPS